MTTLKKLLAKVAATILIPGIIYLVFLLLRPTVFGNLNTLYTVFLQSVTYTIIGWGISFNMIAGNMDMSVGAEMTLGTITAAIAAARFGVLGIVAAALCTTLVVGALKFFVLKMIKTSSMVISIAYTLILGSLGSVVAQDKSLVITSGQTLLSKTPWNFIIFAVMGVLMLYLQRFSVFGAHCRAIGGNAALSNSAGINKWNTYGKGILISSLYAGVAAIITLSRGSGAAAQSGLNSMTPMFSAMMGVFIAMVLARYINMAVGIIVGTFSMNVLGMGLVALGVPSDIKNTVTGAFLLILMGVSTYKEHLNAQMLRRSVYNAQKAAARAQQAVQ